MVLYEYVLHGSELIALLVGTYYFFRIKNRFLYLYIYALIGFSTDLLSQVLIKSGSQNILWISHWYFPLEFVLITIFYIPVLAPVITRRWMLGIIAVFLLFSIMNVLFLQELSQHSQMRIYSSLILVVFSLLYFSDTLRKASIPRLSSEPMIWINASVLIHYSSIFFYNLLANSIIRLTRDSALLFVSINGYIIAFFYLMIGLSFWLEGRKHNTKKIRR